MKIYRGIKDILFKRINHLFKNEDLTFLDYGRGTSYAHERFLAEEYFHLNKNFAWLITAEFSPKNPLHIYSSTLIDCDSIDEGFLFSGGEHVERNEISNYAIRNGHDCIIFEHDEFDPHILLLDGADEPIIKELELCTESQEVVDSLRKFNFPFDGTIFKIPLDKTKEVDQILEKFI